MDEDKPKQFGLRIFFTIMSFFVGFSTVGWIAIQLYDRYHLSATLTANMTKFAGEKDTLYIAYIRNESEAHAEDVTFKADFINGFVREMNVLPTTDLIDKKNVNYGRPAQSANFSLKRLSKRSLCNVDITVRGKSEVKEDINISWKNGGSLHITPVPADEASMSQFKSILRFHEITDSSYLARKRWFESNNKGINK
ncbi:MAG: hypothetical protein ABSG75_08190 [Syntrophales bacterium]|jgi:hypothetical protein